MNRLRPIILALLAAVFYAVSVPCSKLLLVQVGPTVMAALLYLSIFLYVRAQNSLGAAKTSAYYAVAPFVGAFLSFAFLHERLTGWYLIALAVMLGGSALVVADTLIRNHAHPHRHTFTHTHDGTTHTHTVTHVHAHNHYLSD